MKLKGYINGLALVVWLIATGAGAAAAAADGDFVLVTHIDNDVTAISRMEAELMFLGKMRSWPNRKSTNVVINENPQIYGSFSRVILRRSPRQFLIFRKKMLFRGQGMPPPTVKTDKAVIEFVTAHVGGLGYVSPEAVTSDVKVVPISK
jgi:hypothetical protein